VRALVLKDHLDFRADYPQPTAAAGEAVVRVSTAGICRTDVEIVKGYKGFRGVLGHELCGVVSALPRGDKSALPIGTRVVAEINCVPAGSLSRSAAERAQDPARTTLGIFRHDGAFADYVTVPRDNLHRVPDGVSDDEAVFCEPLAAACQILEQVHLGPSSRVYVLGDGKLGLLCAQVIATAAPCQLLVIGKHQRGLELLRRLGIATLHLSEWDGSRSADVVIECSGAAASFELARRMLRPRGTLVLKSTYAASPDAAARLEAFAAWQESLTQLVVDEITVVGSRCGPFAAALRLLSDKRVQVRPLIEASYPLEAGLKAMEHAATRGALKVLLRIAPEVEGAA
jgi:alcohol dehydrogenase